MNYEKYIIKIIEDTGLSREEINIMMKERIAELKKRISKEEVLFIITKELAIDID